MSEQIQAAAVLCVRFYADPEFDGIGTGEPERSHVFGGHLFFIDKTAFLRHFDPPEVAVLRVQVVPPERCQAAVPVPIVPGAVDRADLFVVELYGDIGGPVISVARKFGA